MRGLRVGFNHNVYHKGRIFHVQSEDMGRHYGYAITHVFDDAGRVVKTRRLSYAEFQQDTQVMTQIHELLRAQHTRVVDEIVQGIFDEQPPTSGLRGSVEPPTPPNHLVPTSGVRPLKSPNPPALSHEHIAPARRASRA